MATTIEDEYGISRNQVPLERRYTKMGKALDVFPNPAIVDAVDPAKYSVTFNFPEFTCLCPRTGHPDFASITIKYIPGPVCIEMKSLKYYFNSFRNEGHFHEQVCNKMYDELVEILEPIALQLVGSFNPRGGTYPVIEVGDDLGLVQS